MTKACSHGTLDACKDSLANATVREQLHVQAGTGRYTWEIYAERLMTLSRVYRWWSMHPCILVLVPVPVPKAVAVLSPLFYPVAVCCSSWWMPRFLAPVLICCSTRHTLSDVCVLLSPLEPCMLFSSDITACTPAPCLSRTYAWSPTVDAALLMHALWCAHAQLLEVREKAGPARGAALPRDVLHLVASAPDCQGAF